MTFKCGNWASTVNMGRLTIGRLEIFLSVVIFQAVSTVFFHVRGGSGGLNVKTQPESRCPELLANFCDMLLRKTPYSKKLTSDEIQAKLKDVVSLLAL